MQYSYEPYSVSKIEYKFKNMEFWSIKQTNQFTTDTFLHVSQRLKDINYWHDQVISYSPSQFITELKKIQVKMNMYICSSPLNSPRLAFSFLSFFISFFPLLLSSDIFSFIILIEFCTLSTPLVSLLPSIASDPKQTI